DFIVKPGYDPGQIHIGFSGVQGLSIDPAGDLVLKTDGDPVIQKKPVAYQGLDGTQSPVDAAYVITGDHVEFKIGAYDRSKPLIIDPQMIYATYFGGTGSEIAYGVAVDS